jgi:hypothetical protein
MTAGRMYYTQGLNIYENNKLVDESAVFVPVGTADDVLAMHEAGTLDQFIADKEKILNEAVTAATERAVLRGQTACRFLLLGGKIVTREEMLQVVTEQQAKDPNIQTPPSWF